MSDSGSNLTITISGDASALKDELSSTTSAIGDLSDGLKEHAEGMGGVWQTAFGVGAAELFEKALEKVWETAKEVFSELVTESIAAASANEEAVTRLNTALAGSGQYSAEASQDFQEFAEALQKTTTYSENQIMQSGALIESLTHLDEAGLKQATHGAVELSAALGIDLNTASMMVAKAINGNVTQFQRYGIEVEAGANKTENLANLMQALASFTGVAEQQAQTYAGAMKQLSMAHEDDQKNLGQLVTQNVAVIDVIHAVTGIMYENADGIKANAQQWRVWIAEGVVMAAKSLTVFASVLDSVMRFATADFEIIMVPVKLLIAEFVALQQVIHGNVAAAFDSFKQNAVSAFKDVGKSFTDDTKLGALTIELARIQQAAETGLGAVEKGAIAAVEPVNRTTAAVKALTDANEELAKEGLKIIKEQDEHDPSTKYKKDLAALEAANDQKLISDQQYAAAAFKVGPDLR